MNSYTVEVKPAARREREALPDHVLSRVVRKLESLGHMPRPARVGDWGVLYIIDDAARLVRMTRIAHRREVYE